MKRVGLVRVLKGTVVFLTAMLAFVYVVALPQRITSLAQEFPEFSWMAVPGIAAVSLSAVPIVVALALFWRICTEIGRDNSFCRKNAGRLTGIGCCALIDTGYCAVGTVTVEMLAGRPIWLLGLGLCSAGLAVAVAAFLLSHLVMKAADLKAENDLTI